MRSRAGAASAKVAMVLSPCLGGQTWSGAPPALNLEHTSFTEQDTLFAARSLSFSKSINQAINQSINRGRGCEEAGMPGLLNPSKSQNLSVQFGFASLTCPQSLLRFYSRSKPRWHQAFLPDEQELADSQTGFASQATGDTPGFASVDSLVVSTHPETPEDLDIKLPSSVGRKKREEEDSQSSQEPNPRGTFPTSAPLLP